jgi:hypothetical protein
MIAEEICNKLDIDYTKVLNIYPYGSVIYLTNTEKSDDDFIIVFKSALLPSGSFKDNSKSSIDRKIQGTCYSRGGFIDAINNYQISALECIFLPAEKIIQNKFPFKLQKFNQKEFAKKIITTASSSWYNATLAYKDENIEHSKKNVYHALRILDFGIQIKNNQKIVDYSAMNENRILIYDDNDFKPKKWLNMFLELSEKIK